MKKLLFLLIINIIFTQICYIDEYYDSTSNSCKRCDSILKGCFKCSYESTFQCFECESGYSQTASSTGTISLCTPQCTFPKTIYASLPKDNYDYCQWSLLLNEERQRYRYSFISIKIRETSQSELSALNDLYISLNGVLWTNSANWNDGDPCVNKWYGIECDKRGHIIGINFFQNNLNGIIPDSISQLTYLEYIHILNHLFEDENNDANYIYYVSPKIFQIKTLKDIVIKNCHLKQSLNKLFDLNSEIEIEIIDLSGNLLFGNIVNLEYFTTLVELNLSFNNITGDLSNLDSLASTTKNIFLQSNNITGNIPNLNNLMNVLEVLDLRNNTLLNGDIPSNFFSENYFEKFIYIGLMLTQVTVPNTCSNSPFCIKRLIINSKSIYDDNFELTNNEIQFLLPRT